MKNEKYTWTNRRQGFTCIAEKLDHLFLFGNWTEMEKMVEASIFPFSGSNHFPIQLTIALDNYSDDSIFRFEKM